MAAGFTTWHVPHFLILLLVLTGCGSDSGGSGFLIANQAPVALAGADQNVTTGSEVTLDGGGSTDPDGDELVFLWEILSLPPQSTATLSDPAAPGPVFIADLPEAYVFRLSVTDPLGETSSDLVVVTAYTAPRVNTPPTALIAPLNDALVGNPVQLDGSGSADADPDDSLSYHWELTVPDGSQSTLTGAASALPTFTPDVAGNYLITLRVSDIANAEAFSAAQLKALVGNIAPVANAGIDQNGTVSEVILLDGSASSDANGDPLSFSWSYLFRPPGSAAELESSQSAQAYFIADVAGTYLVSLTVSDGTLSSQTDNVKIQITRVNSPPQAVIAPLNEVPVGTLVTLDGSGSSDPDAGDVLSYAWVLTPPTGSVAVLDPSIQKYPTFTPDLAGSYLVTLTLTDTAGEISSVSTLVQAVISNVAPIASAGADQTAKVSDVILLDGSASSDANGDPLSFSWSFASRPTGSAASLTNPDTAQPFFTADVAGDYILRLTVNDGQLDSSADNVKITISAVAP